MTDEAPNPGNNLILRMVQGVRRDVQDMSEREARVIELLGRMNLRLDDVHMRLNEMNARMDQGFARLDRGLSDVRSDIVLLENRAITAVTEVRRVAERLDEAEAARPPEP
ncbi:hypothetical protein [Methylobacterium durans]|uniref:Uncharacterized protein n=1 Tax=Methylobacterium durans TaxID=2202825 RepID=A0A2U8WCP5_9HYPH|nr:hypothetical protein [Methylobacterium durans]AWN43917.1 hypothetical protein DK389_29645 [Methylobacterium durans]